MGFFRVEDLPEVEMLPGVGRRAVWLEGVMLTFFDFEPNTVVPEHAHPHQQITFVLEGAMEFTLGEETRLLRAGEGVCIEPGVSHGALVQDERTRALDAWHPVREDYQ